MPDIDTQEYIYSFERLGNVSEEEFDEIYSEIARYMHNFSKENGIEEFAQNVRIWVE